MVPLEAGKNQSVRMHLAEGLQWKVLGSPPPPVSSPESLGQPANLTFESSAKSSCCSSVSQSRSDPFLPRTQVPPPPGSGNVPEITLHLPHKGVGVGVQLGIRYPWTPFSRGGGAAADPNPGLPATSQRVVPSSLTAVPAHRPGEASLWSPSPGWLGT